MKNNKFDIEELGEEAGREEAGEDYPDIPDVSSFSEVQYAKYSRMLTRYGRGRAQGLYELRGKEARLFAKNFAMGYLANCRIFKEDLEQEEEEEEMEEEVPLLQVYQIDVLATATDEDLAKLRQFGCEDEPFIANSGYSVYKAVMSPELVSEVEAMECVLEIKPMPTFKPC